MDDIVIKEVVPRVSILTPSVSATTAHINEPPQGISVGVDSISHVTLDDAGSYIDWHIFQQRLRGFSIYHVHEDGWGEHGLGEHPVYVPIKDNTIDIIPASVTCNACGMVFDLPRIRILSDASDK